MKDNVSSCDGHRSITSLRREIDDYKYEIKLINAGIQRRGSVRLINKRITALMDQIKEIKASNKERNKNLQLKLLKE